jgi:hypothetical protein
MPGGLAGIVATFGLGELAQKRMPQHVRGDIDFLILGEMGIGLGSNTQDDTIRFTAREPPAGARQKEDRGGVLPCLEPFVQDLRASRCKATKSRITPPLICTRVNPLPVYWSLSSRWRETQACHDNTCGESKGHNSHNSLLHLTCLIAATGPKASIY